MQSNGYPENPHLTHLFIDPDNKLNDSLIQIYCYLLIQVESAEVKSLGILLEEQEVRLFSSMQIEQFKSQQTSFYSSGFAARDGAARDLQEKGEVSFKLVRNDQQKASVKKLVDLKNIFARQLPKMPKQYIVKLVFDRNHQAMIVQKGQKVIGGICFRTFQTEGFAEIAFLAISSTQQVRGFGTRLMNKLKQQMQKRRIGTLMTYADNLALGYFRKQGFSADCKIAVQRWRGYVKDYQGGTMMECRIHPHIDYSMIGQIVAKQKKYVIEQVKKLLINHISYSGANIPNGPSVTRVNRLGQTEVFRIDPCSIPGVIQSGWTWEEHQTLLSLPRVSFTAECQDFLQSLVRHSSSWPFRQAVSLQDVPDYLTVVREPMDLKTMEKKLVNNQYTIKEDFLEDLSKIFKNCRVYNQQGTIYYNCANQLEEYANSLPLIRQKNKN